MPEAREVSYRFHLHLSSQLLHFTASISCYHFLIFIFFQRHLYARQFLENAFGRSCVLHAAAEHGDSHATISFHGAPPRISGIIYYAVRHRRFEAAH